LYTSALSAADVFHTGA